MKPNIALFDFDGTITTKDTLFEFIKFVRGNFQFYVFMTYMLPWLIALKLGLVSAKPVKERLLKLAIGNANYQHFAKSCENFCLNRLPALLRPNAILALETHLQKGDKVAIVSASPEVWIRPWAGPKNIQVISTRLKVENNLVSGEIDGNNCNGPEKVARIKTEINLNDFEKIYAYGDSNGDKELLALADYPFYRKFS